MGEFREHDVFTEPDEDSTVWRYLDFSNFIYLIENSQLHFHRLDDFEDPFEGVPNKTHLISRLEKSIEQEKSISEMHPDYNYEISDVAYNHKALINYWRYTTFVNSWALAGRESMALWNSYLTHDDGVAIKSTYGNLKESLEKESDRKFWASKVDYMGFEEDYREPIRNVYRHSLTKRVEFIHDNELRVGISKKPEGEDDLYPDEQMYQGHVSESLELPQPTGLNVDVNLDKLIKEVKISPASPDWHTPEFISNLLETHSVDFESVSSSELDIEFDEIYDAILDEVKTDEDID